MTIPMQDVFSFWEADLDGEAVPSGTPVSCGALALAIELQTADWTEDEAGAELARRCDARSLHAAQEALVEALQTSPALVVRAICASRALWLALDIVEAPTGTATRVRPNRWRLRGWRRTQPW